MRAVSCGLFTRDYLLGLGPHGSAGINPQRGAPQTDIFCEYKLVLIRTTAEDKAVRSEEKTARKEERLIDPDRIASLTLHYLEGLGYKSIGCTYHSYVTCFSMIQKLEWVEPSGIIEPSSFQDNYAQGQPRIFYRLSEKGKAAPAFIIPL